MLSSTLRALHWLVQCNGLLPAQTSNVSLLPRNSELVCKEIMTPRVPWWQRSSVLWTGVVGTLFLSSGFFSCGVARRKSKDEDVEEGIAMTGTSPDQATC
eukprot:TRINITY_DN17803_c0_g1_i1.p2 TRINITY_DN17803_c0_g1~~TRINITY_DN17803_c0_g1_i1.p2  ORF type:complete len:100 (-),score=11.77 TRINITY_DN17803_c0_g1_i1:789-1088(-)